MQKVSFFKRPISATEAFPAVLAALKVKILEKVVVTGKMKKTRAVTSMKMMLHTKLVWRQHLLLCEGVNMLPACSTQILARV
jgi:hypothetical protein